MDEPPRKAGGRLQRVGRTLWTLEWTERTLGCCDSLPALGQGRSGPVLARLVPAWCVVRLARRAGWG